MAQGAAFRHLNNFDRSQVPERSSASSSALTISCYQPITSGQTD
jgi:hypothetical protein